MVQPPARCRYGSLPEPERRARPRRRWRRAGVVVLRAPERGGRSRSCGSAQAHGRARHDPPDGRGRADACGWRSSLPTSSTRPCCFIRPWLSGRTASTRSTACRLTALTVRRFAALASETIGRRSMRRFRAGVRPVFTGIVSDFGEVLEVNEQAEGLRRLTIACGYDPDGIDIGASIACSGPCLTVVARGREGQSRLLCRRCGRRDAEGDHCGRLATRHAAQSRTLAAGRRRTRRPYRQRPCRWHCGACSNATICPTWRG